MASAWSWPRVSLLALVLLLVGDAAAGILVTSTSSPTLSPRAPLIVLSNVGPPACTFVPNANQTGGATTVIVSGGTDDHGGCVQIRNSDTVTWVYKVVHVSTVNPGRLNDLQIKGPGGNQHIKYSGGSLSVAETSGWLSLTAGTTNSISVRERTDNGAATTITAKLLVARDGMQARVWAEYPLTFTLTAS